MERAKSAGDCFKILCKEGIFTPSDVIAMQFLLQETKCEDLEKECVKYAKIKNAMYYYETPSGIVFYIRLVAKHCFIF